MFFSVFQVNREIHLALHREQTKKCFLEESWEGLGGAGGRETKSFDADFFPPQKTSRKERQDSF